MGKYHKVSYTKTIVETHVNRLAHRVIEIAVSNKVPFSEIRYIASAVIHRKAVVEVDGSFTGNPNRYFIDGEFLFHDGGKTYALTNQWTTDQVERVVKLLADKFPHLHLKANFDA